MDWIKFKSFRFSRPDLADVFIGRKPIEGLEPAGEVIGCHEVGKVCPQLAMVFIVEAFNGRLLDGAVHSFNLSIGPWMVWHTAVFRRVM